MSACWQYFFASCSLFTHPYAIVQIEYLSSSSIKCLDNRSFINPCKSINAGSSLQGYAESKRFELLYHLRSTCLANKPLYHLSNFPVDNFLTRKETYITSTGHIFRFYGLRFKSPSTVVLPIVFLF